MVGGEVSVLPVYLRREGKLIEFCYFLQKTMVTKKEIYMMTVYEFSQHLKTDAGKKDALHYLMSTAIRGFFETLQIFLYVVITLAVISYAITFIERCVGIVKATRNPSASVQAPFQPQRCSTEPVSLYHEEIPG